MTCHREENAGSDETLTEILSAMNSLEYPCIYPVHPRNQQRVERLQEQHKFENIITCKPVGYLMSVFLTLHAQKIVTDSGGLQREAFFAEKQCVTVFDHIVWPETMVDNRNQLASPQKKDILEKLKKRQLVQLDKNPFGDGKSSVQIVRIMDDFYRNHKE